MMSAEKNSAIQSEQAAFEQLLPALLKEHTGQYVVVKNAQAVGFHVSFDDAYTAALNTYGVDTIFLIAKIEPARKAATSLAWDCGVMFSETLVR